MNQPKRKSVIMKRRTATRSSQINKKLYVTQKCKRISDIKHSDYINHLINQEPNLLSETEMYLINDKVINYFNILIKLEISLEEDQEVQQNQQIFDSLPIDQTQFQRKSRILQTNVVKKKQSRSLGQLMQACLRSFKKAYNSFICIFMKHLIVFLVDTVGESFVFLPESDIKLMWDLLCMMLIFYEIISIPFQLSFDVQISRQWDICVNVIFISDILVAFNTGIYINGNLVLLRKKIAIEYFKLWFWLDLAASFPYEDSVLLFSGEEISADDSIKQSTQVLKMLKFLRFIKILRLLRLAKLKVIFDKIEELLQLSSTFAAIMSFLQLSVFVLFWSHWLGCIFHFITQYESQDDNWLVSIGIQQETQIVKYINSLYWAVTTMNTVGYGDISPQTPMERLFGIFFLLVACGVFSFTLNTIGTTLQQIGQKKQEYANKMKDINNYMKRQEIPIQLQNRVKRYLSYIWDSEHPVNIKIITDNLSCSLKYQFTITVNGKLLSSCHFFVHYFSQKFLTEITQIFEETIILPDEIIFKENACLEYHLYFIIEGFVQIYLKKRKLAQLEKKDYFGEISFFSNQGRTASAKSINFTNLFYINQSKFISILQKYPKDLERYAFIKDSIVIDQDYSALNLNCYACLRDDHAIKNCPSLHFIVNQYVFQKIQKQQFAAKMKQFVRRDITLFQARKNLQQIQNAQQLIEEVAYRTLKDTSNVEDDEFLQLPPIQNKNFTAPFVSKFKSDKSNSRRLEKHLRKQNKRLSELKEISKINSQLYQEIGKAMQGNNQAIYNIAYFSQNLNQKSQNFFTQANVDDDLDLQQKSSSQNVGIYKSQLSSGNSSESSSQYSDHITRKLKSILISYQRQQSKIINHINDENPHFTQIGSFGTIPDFDIGTDFEFFRVHNNLSVVLQEYDNYNRYGIGAKPLINTEYEYYIISISKFISDEVYDNLNEYYHIIFPQIDEHFKKNHLSSMNFTQQRLAKLDRQV